MRNEGNDARFRHRASDSPCEDIKLMGGENPRQVPGFPHYYLCDGGELFSVKGRIAVRIKPQRGRYLRMSEGENDISVTSERLEYCVENNICPTLLSRCKLAVAREDSGLMLMDVTDYVISRKKEEHKKKCNNIEMLLSENIKWSTHLLAYYRGEDESLTHIKKMINERQKKLEAYIRNTLQVHDNNRVAYITEECMSEMLQRIVNRTALVVSPLIYMESMARSINQRIRKVHGKVFCDNNVFHVKGDMSQIDMSRRCRCNHY